MVVTGKILFPFTGNEAEVNEFLITQISQLHTKAVHATHTFRARVHISTGLGRHIGQLFITHQTGHFFNQIFFDFNIKTVSRRFDMEDFIGKREFKAKTLEALSHRGRVNIHTDYLACSISAHRHLTAFGQNGHCIDHRTDSRGIRAANFRDQPRDVLQNPLGLTEVHTTFIAISGVGREIQAAAATLNSLLMPES